jgi:DNA-binding transcriptional MerR regulator
VETQPENETYPIGELARRTGLPVKTIRYYSDIGVLPPAERTRSGYRRYGAADVIRLDLVRTLRELGIDLGTIRQVLDRQTSLADVLSLHAEALAAQAKALQVRRAVLRATVAAGASPEYLARAQRVARLTAAERSAIVHGFLDQIMGDAPVDPAVAAHFRDAVPALPDDPTAEQIDAWVELAELVTDEDYVRRLREGVGWFWREVDGRYDHAAFQAANEELTAAAVEAVAAGRSPTDPASRPAFDAFIATQARLHGRTDSPDFRAWLLSVYETGHDPRSERYWQLVAVVNGWPATPSPIAAAYRWLIDGLRADSRRTEPG